jgi:hypothetical protein
VAVVGDELAGVQVVAVDPAQHLLGVRLAPHGVAVHGQVPVQLDDRPVALVGRVRQPLPDDPAEVVGEPEVGALVVDGFDGLLAPLQHPLGLRERALLLHVRRGREEEHLGAALLGHDLAGVDLRRVLPERGRLDHREVADDHPVELGHREPHQPPVRHRHGGVLAEQEVAGHLALDHVQRGAEDAVVAVDAREVVEAVVVVGGGALAPVLLEQRHQVRVGGVPEALLLAAADRRDVRVEVRVAGEGIGR